MRELNPKWDLAIKIVAGLWGLTFLWLGLIGLVDRFTISPIAIGMASILVFSLYPMGKKSPQSHPSALDLLLILTTLLICTYAFLHRVEFMAYQWKLGDNFEAAMGLILGLILLEATRRPLGWMPVIFIAFVAFYAFFIAPLMPGRFWHPGQKFSIYFSALLRHETGIFGGLAYLVIAVVSIFMFFGPVLFATGAGNVFLLIGRWIGSKISGGAGMFSVVSSALFGTLSGSATANVVTTGSFTIPIMIKSGGYKPSFAAAVEATASTGGQIMPPVMGAVAFLMPEFIGGITYLDVMKAAIIPAILYFLTVGFGNYFYAKRQGLGKLTGENAASFKDVLKAGRGVIALIGCFGVLLYLLIMRWPIIVCGSWALLSAVFLHLVSGGPLKQKELKERLSSMLKGWIEGAKVFSWLFLFLAAISIAITAILRSGFADALSWTVASLGRDSVFLALLLTTVTALILGMGITTTAAYVLVASVLSAPLSELLGVPLVAHFFIFWMSLLGCLTPPVCASVYPAAAIAKAPWLSVARNAMLLGMVLFFLPFFFAYEPALLMIGSASHILISVVTALFGIFFLSAGVWGYFIRPATPIERILFIGGGLAGIYPGITTDLIGLMAIATGIVFHLVISRYSKKEARVS